MNFAKIAYSLWAITLLGILSMLVICPGLLTPEGIKMQVLKMGTAALFVYFGLSLIRGFFLLPSTPFVLAGVCMYPASPWTVIGISMLGIMTSAVLLYWFSDTLGFSTYLDRRFPKPIAKARKLLTGKYSFLVVAGWSFFPLVSTDVICYVAGLVKMPLQKMLLGLLIGEMVLVSSLVYIGRETLSLLETV